VSAVDDGSVLHVLLGRGHEDPSKLRHSPRSQSCQREPPRRAAVGDAAARLGVANAQTFSGPLTLRVRPKFRCTEQGSSQASRYPINLRALRHPFDPYPPSGTHTHAMANEHRVTRQLARACAGMPRARTSAAVHSVVSTPGIAVSCDTRASSADEPSGLPRAPPKPHVLRLPRGDLPPGWLAFRGGSVRWQYVAAFVPSPRVASQRPAAARPRSATMNQAFWDARPWRRQVD
jgi:hypothetical protein